MSRCRSLAAALVAVLVLLAGAAVAVAYAPGDHVTVDGQGGTVQASWQEGGQEHIVVNLEPTATPTPTPTPTSTPTPTPTPSPTPTPTPSPTPTPTPSPTPTPTPTPEPPAFPDESNTGVPAGTTLTAYTGPSNIAVNGTVIDGKTTGCLQIGALNVTIKNSVVRCGGGIAVYLRDGASASLTVVDSEIDCRATNGTALSEAHITLLRVDIHDCENGGDVNQDWDVRDSYIHDVYNGGGAHADGFQMGCGHWVGSGSACGASGFALGAKDVTFVHNTIDSTDPAGNGGTSAIISNRLTNGNPAGPDQDILIQGNLLEGGAYPLYCEQDGAHYINGQVLDNAFKRGAFGFSDHCADEVQSGNYVYGTGEPLTLG